jgi:hypothetical protein
VTLSPCLKAGASTVNPTAQANLRLTDGLVGLRCPEDFDIDGDIVIPVDPLKTKARNKFYPPAT